MNKLQDIKTKVDRVLTALNAAKTNVNVAIEMAANLSDELDQMEQEMEAEYLAKKIREEQESGVPVMFDGKEVTIRKK